MSLDPLNATFVADDGQGHDALTVSAPYGYSVAGVSLLAFKLTHIAVGRVFKPPASCKSDLDRWKWMNIAISWIHSTIIGIACIYSICYAHPELMSELVEYNNAFIYTVTSVSTGYFIYDFLDVVLNGHSGAMWEVLVHHVAVLNSFVYNITQCRFIGYSIVALCVEVNSILLHTRKLMQMDGRVGYQSVTYRLIVGLNLVSFFVIRLLFSLPVITYGIATMSSTKCSTYYFFSLSLTMTLTWIVNVMLFWRLVKSDLLRHRQRRPADATGRRKDTDDASLKRMRVANGNNNSFDNLVDCEDYRLKKSQ